MYLLRHQKDKRYIWSSEDKFRRLGIVVVLMMQHIEVEAPPIGSTGRIGGIPFHERILVRNISSETKYSRD
jgi:hypothetical protein